jgi:hypothetical protein
VLFLAVILGAVFIERPIFLREALMIAAAAGSYFTTPKAVPRRQPLQFSSHPGGGDFICRDLLHNDAALDWLQWNAGTTGSSLNDILLLGKRPRLELPR